MVICFRPGNLSEKLDSLTHRADFYLKRGDRDYMLVNPQNLCLIFTQEQLATSLHTTHLQEVITDAATLIDTSIPILDISALLEDIKAGYAVDPLASRELSLCLQGSPSPRYSVSASGLLLLDSCVYIPDYQPKRGSLRTHVLQSKHNHPTASHFGHNKTLELLRHDYVWPNIRSDCKKYVSQCILCTRNKYLQHCPYSLLQPLPIPEQPWHSISMDFIEQLPSSNSFTSILVVIDRLAKESVFIPTTDNATATDIADAFVTHVSVVTQTSMLAWWIPMPHTW